MNNYASLRKQNNSPAFAAMALALCVVLSASVMFERLAAYSTRDIYQNIPLTKSAGITTVINGQRDENGVVHFAEAARFDPDAPVVLSYSPFLAGTWFQVTDENTVWQGETNVEIFRISYENGEGNVTVQSNRGDKVIAPGTSNMYKFQLENTGSHAVQYTMNMEAYFTDGTYAIPVNARVFDKYGKFYAGTETEMVDVLELNGVADSGTLKAGYIMPYTLEWEWPFEEDDVYDTMLGNLAVEEDITLTIVIKTTATYSPDPPGGGDGEPPKTGDIHFIMTMGTMSVSGTMLLILLLLPKRRKEEEYPQP